MDKIIYCEEKYIDEVVQLFLDVFENEPWNDSWPSKEKAKQYLLDITNTPGFIGYLKYKDNQLIGALLGHIVHWWEGDEFFIKEFFVDRHLQNKGIGSQLMEHLKVDLQNKNVHTMLLLTESNAPAAKFYQKRGFKVSSHTIFMFKNI